jgi:hypothetical protein
VDLELLADSPLALILPADDPGFSVTALFDLAMNLTMLLGALRGLGSGHVSEIIEGK